MIKTLILVAIMSVSFMASKCTINNTGTTDIVDVR